jgi:hypothetical protein
VNLLKDQELYEENPALEMFEPPPALPSQQPRGAPQPPSPPQQQGQPQQPQPAQIPQPAQLTLSPQGESVLANSLKESVAAQSKVVEKLFDEMKELSRKIDEKRSAAPMPPIVLNMQAGAGQAPQRPIQMDLPSSGPQPEGFPRYASSDQEESDEQVPGSSQDMASEEMTSPGWAPEDMPPGDMPPQAGRPDAHAAEEEPAVTLEELPEELEPVTDELPAMDDLPSRAPAPAGWPGLEPITDAEPEPEIAGDVQEQPEAELEQLEPMAETGPGNAPSGSSPASPDAGRPPSAGTGGDGPTAASRSGEDVRKELRGYFSSVRDRLDKGGGHAGPGDLLDYLGKLSDYLPDREKKRFRGSTERLAMESLKARLAGKQSLRQKVAGSHSPPVMRQQKPMTRSRVVDTFSYLRDLAAWHPDKAVGAAMRDRIESIVARMGRSK